MASPFAKLHDVMARSQFSLLSESDQGILQKIADGELEGLGFCWRVLKSNDKMYEECCKRYLIAGHEIKKCISF